MLEQKFCTFSWSRNHKCTYWLIKKIWWSWKVKFLSQYKLLKPVILQKGNFKYYEPGVNIKYISLRYKCLCVRPPQRFKVTCLMGKPLIVNATQLKKSYFQYTCTTLTYKLHRIVSFSPACSNVTGILPFANTHGTHHTASRGRLCFCLALNQC